MPLFTSIFCTIAAFSLYGEYVVRSFLPNDDVFLPSDHGLDFRHELCENSINSINQSISTRFILLAAGNKRTEAGLDGQTYKFRDSRGRGNPSWLVS